jgi:pimeloyl-ACP methyl ester carboxylesterase
MNLVTLPDGRHVAVGDFGDPAGTPVLLCHGSLASWRYRHPDDSIATRLGVRLLTAARPGFGASTRTPHRSVADWADTVADVADALGLDRFAVVGHSGGGPHALACAARLAGRVSAVAVAGSLAPFDAPARFAELGPMAQTLFESARGELDDVERGLEPVGAMFLATAAQSVGALFEGHADGFEDTFVADLEDALAPGVGGWADELRALVRPWGFDLADVGAPVSLWYGEDDELSPTHGAALARELGVEPRVHAGGHQAWLAVWPDLLRSVTST